MPTVRVYGALPTSGGQVFFSLEHIPIVLAEVRAALSQLEKELKIRWPVERVEIENRRPRLRNPIDPALVEQALAVAGVGLVIYFGKAVVTALGTKVGDAVGDEIAKHVQSWLRQFPHGLHAEASNRRAANLRKPCECGCGEYPKKAESRFLPGHDLRKAYNETGSSLRRGSARARGKR